MKPEWKSKVGMSWEPEMIVSSGSLKLDYSDALSNYRGIPAGSMIQISSSGEGSYKTSLALAGAKELQKLGHKVVYIDAEGGITGTTWLAGMGLMLDEDHWLYAQPESGEEAFEMARYFIEESDYKGIIIDSIDAAVPSKILESNMGSSNIGNHAKLVTQAIRNFKTSVRVNQKFLWLVNQLRPNITNMGQRGSKPTGGFAIGFYCKLNLQMSREKSDSQLIGESHIPLKIRIGRSKIGHGSWDDISTYAIQGVGIDTDAELVDYAIEFGLIKKAGSWYKELNGDSIGQGMLAAREWAILNKDEILNHINNELDKDKEETN